MCVGAWCFESLRLDDATHVNHLSDLIMFTRVNCADHPFYANDSRYIIYDDDHDDDHDGMQYSASNIALLLSGVENFQNDRLELYEEPTIEEMEAAIEEMERENSAEDDLEFIAHSDDAVTGEEMNHKRHHDQNQESDVPVKRTRNYST